MVEVLDKREVRKHQRLGEIKLFLVAPMVSEEWDECHRRSTGRETEAPHW